MATNSPFSDTHALNWQNTHTVLEHIKSSTLPLIYESLVDDYGFGKDDYNDDYTYDNLHEIINELSEVFVTYKAQMIARAFCISPFEDSPITGERYNSWNEIAFDILMDEFTTQYSEQLNSVA